MVPEDRWEHGKRYTYTKLKCRCDLCKEANALYKLNKTAYYRNLQASQARESNSPATQDLLDSLTHGLLSTYEWYGCRCPECREAKATEMTFYKLSKVLAS